MSILNCQYYDFPDGKDAFGKMVATNKYALITGLAWSTCDVCLYSRTKGYLPTLARFAYNIGPLMGMASAFTLVTYVSTNARGKDDKLNYFLGGMAAGSVAGAWARSPMIGFQVGLLLGIAGAVKKLSKEEGWDFFPPLKTHEYGTVNGHDFTLMAERPRTWTTGKETNN